MCPRILRRNAGSRAGDVQRVRCLRVVPHPDRPHSKVGSLGAEEVEEAHVLICFDDCLDIAVRSDLFEKNRSYDCLQIRTFRFCFGRAKGLLDSSDALPFVELIAPQSTPAAPPKNVTFVYVMKSWMSRNQSCSSMTSTRYRSTPHVQDWTMELPSAWRNGTSRWCLAVTSLS